MSPLTGLARDRDDSFPRVSGDEPTTGKDTTHEYEFSPRERG